VILAYKATDDVTLNAQVSKGFRLGGINDPLNRPLCTPADFATFNALSSPSFKNETVWNYEAGLKAKLAAAGLADPGRLLRRHLEPAGHHRRRQLLVADHRQRPQRQVGGLRRRVRLQHHRRLRRGGHGLLQQRKLTSSLKDASGQPIQGLADGNRLPTVPKFQTSFSVGYKHEVASGLEGFSNSPGSTSASAGPRSPTRRTTRA
jgi:iron complex outermembrane receptor protein